MTKIKTILFIAGALCLTSPAMADWQWPRGHEIAADWHWPWTRRPPAQFNDPTARDKNVKDVLAEFLAHQLWEKSHPGELWDAPKR
jgi:hypothetical protein